jgi:hypothetical protein
MFITSLIPYANEWWNCVRDLNSNQPILCQHRIWMRKLVSDMRLQCHPDYSTLWAVFARGQCLHHDSFSYVMQTTRLFQWPERAPQSPSPLQAGVNSSRDRILTINCHAWQSCMSHKVSRCEQGLEQPILPMTSYSSKACSTPLRDWYELLLKSIVLIRCITCLGVMHIEDMYATSIFNKNYTCY